MSRFGKVFYGVTPSDQRTFLAQVWSELDVSGRFYNPACGQFALVKAALQAGIDAEQVYASDVSLFSSILGFYYDDGHLDRLDINPLPLRITVKAGDEDHDEELMEIEDAAEVYDRIDDPSRAAAYLLWIIKIKQLSYEKLYERVVVEEYLNRREHYIDHVASELRDARELYEGLTYTEEDMRECTKRPLDNGDLLAVNPPHFSDDYTGMFPVDDVLPWEIDAPQFVLEDEFPWFFTSLREKDGIAFSGVHPKALASMEDSDEYSFQPDERLYASDRGSRWEYWACTKPGRVPSKFHNRVRHGTSLTLKPYKNLPMWGEEDILFPDSEVQVVPVSLEHALYYRQLWFHKIGTSSAGTCFLILIDGKVFATVGFDCSGLMRLQADHVYEIFGCCAQTESRYFNLNLLIELVISSGQMQRLFKDTVSNYNQVWDLHGIKTTCFSKYRHLKSQKMVSDLVFRERRDDGTYHLKYYTPFRMDETFQDQIPKYFSMTEKKLKRRAIDQAYKRHS